MAILNRGDKFCLLSVDACAAPPKSDMQLSDGTWVLTKFPIEMTATWQRWIGELRFNALLRSNFFLLRTLPNGNPANLDDEHIELKQDVTDIFGYFSCPAHFGTSRRPPCLVASMPTAHQFPRWFNSRIFMRREEHRWLM